MNRRGFLGMFAALVAAPIAALRAPALHSPWVALRGFLHADKDYVCDIEFALPVSPELIEDQPLALYVRHEREVMKRQTQRVESQIYWGR